jgi:hypothetical protein
VDKSALERWRAIDAHVVLAAIAGYARRDPDFVPNRDPRTQRWHAVLDQREFVLLVTGPKFWDESARTGGGGAIDLVRHLSNCDFLGAVRKLRSSGL